MYPVGAERPPDDFGKESLFEVSVSAEWSPIGAFDTAFAQLGGHRSQCSKDVVAVGGPCEASVGVLAAFDEDLDAQAVCGGSGVFILTVCLVIEGFERDDGEASLVIESALPCLVVG